MHRYGNRKALLIILALGSIFASLAAVTPTPTAQQGKGWQPPMMISPAEANSWFPDVIGDSTGRIHVVWSSGTTGYDTAIYTASLNGSDWLKINDIAALPIINGSSITTRPALLVDQQGYLDMTYTNTAVYFVRAPINAAHSAAAWSQPIKISGDQQPYYSQLMEDNQGNLHVFYTENVISLVCTQCYHLYSRISTDYGQTWSDSQDISVGNLGVVKPQIVIDSQNHIFVAWEAGQGGGTGQLSGTTDVRFVASLDDGKTWGKPVVLSTQDVKMAKNIAIGIDRNGNLIVAWLGVPDDRIYYQVSVDQGVTWTKPVAIPGIYGGWDVYPSPLDDIKMVADSSGMLHMVMVGRTDANQTSLSVLHLTWDGTTWSKPDVITTISGDVPEWPRIAVSNGNVLNVVWFVRDQADIWKSDTGRYTVWYTREQVNAPAVPTVIPTYLPTATITPLNDPMPTATTPVPQAVPTLSINEKQPQHVIYTENGYVGLLAKAIVPSLLFVLVVMMVVIIRRQ
jgi:hypothetical protein